MSVNRTSGYVLLFVGVFLLGISIPLIDIFIPRAAEEGGMMVNILFVAMVIIGGIVFLSMAWRKLRGPRRD